MWNKTINRLAIRSDAATGFFAISLICFWLNLVAVVVRTQKGINPRPSAWKQHNQLSYAQPCWPLAIWNHNLTISRWIGVWCDGLDCILTSEEKIGISEEIDLILVLLYFCVNWAIHLPNFIGNLIVVPPLVAMSQQFINCVVYLSDGNFCKKLTSLLNDKQNWNLLIKCCGFDENKLNDTREYRIDTNFMEISHWGQSFLQLKSSRKVFGCRPEMHLILRNFFSTIVCFCVHFGGFKCLRHFFLNGVNILANLHAKWHHFS